MRKKYDSDFPPPEEVRLCPDCRMPISVFATRCRFCGAEVSRPRKKEASLTIEDLGGEQVDPYRVSGEVLDALEAFRAEEEAARAQQLRQKQEDLQASWFRRPKETASDPGLKTPSQSGLPDLDSRSRELMSIYTDDKPSAFGPGASRRDAAPVWTQKLALLGMFIAAILLIYFGGGFAMAKIGEYIRSQGKDQQAVFRNEALDLLNRGDPTIRALEAAMEALRAADTPENRRIAQEIRQQFIEEINGLLNGEEWRRDMLNTASSLANRALLADSDPAIRELYEKVDTEVGAYNLVLTAVDPATNSATFRLNDPHNPVAEQTVSPGQYVGKDNRFLVLRVYAKQVRLEDTRIVHNGRGRPIECRLLTPVSPG